MARRNLSALNHGLNYVRFRALRIRDRMHDRKLIRLGRMADDCTGPVPWPPAPDGVPPPPRALRPVHAALSTSDLPGLTNLPTSERRPNRDDSAQGLARYDDISSTARRGASVEGISSGTCT